MDEINNFHDAALIDLNFDWSTRLLRCSVRPVSDTGEVVEVFFEGVQKLIVSCGHPWGRSSSINTLQRTLQGDVFVFNFEMQSGDVIEIYAAIMKVKSTRAE